MNPDPTANNPVGSVIGDDVRTVAGWKAGDARLAAGRPGWRRALHGLLLLAALLASRQADADVVLDWNALMLDAIRADTSGPTLSSRNLAILHTAIYDGVNSVVRTHQPYRHQVDVPPDTSPEAVAVGAAYEVMEVLYPGFRARADELFVRWQAGASSTNGLAIGKLIAQRTLEDRAADGSATDVPYIPSSLPGQWQRTPPFYRPPLTPQWRYVTPFCLPGLDPFLPPPPPPLSSAAYAEAVNVVKALGGKGSALRTAEQSQIAVFWSDFSYTAMPPGHWHEIAATIAADRQNTLAENARLFALLGAAQADAAIVCWEAKFAHNLWRPVTAIRQADEDGNPLTDPDPSWDHFLASPPFPAYTSGHSTFSMASARVLTHFYGTDAITFVARSDSLPGVFRTFHSLSLCADEVGMSRIYGGIHFPFDNTEGKASGARVGEYVSANLLLALDALPAVRLEGWADGAPALRLHAAAGQTCVLEASTDLRHWQPVATNQAALRGALVLDPAAQGLPHQFYRIRQP